VEFALVAPLLLFMVIAIADFGRLYTSAVAIEAAAREAADYGAFMRNQWAPVNVDVTIAEMERRSCVAAAGSHLQDYVSTDPDNDTCTNPTFACSLEHGGSSTPCTGSGGMVGGFDCSAQILDPAVDNPCTVHVRLDYDFHTILGIPPLPTSIAIGRDSRFRISDLAPAPPPP